jgi:hypothetical protein
MQIGAVTWARYIRNERSIPHAVLSYKGFAENRKGETNPVWERDSAAKRPLKRLSFVAADEKAKLAWWPGSSGSNREFYLFGGLGKNNQVRYRIANVDDVNIFYREAGDPKAPTLLLLHGFPTSSHMFRDLIPLLSDRYHVVAPDLPGFGFSDAPDRAQFKYRFEHLADVIDRFTQVVSLERYALYIFDYGAPVGLRLALKHPERVTAIVSQNGNAYQEGLSNGWNPIEKYWRAPTEANRAALRDFLKPETTNITVAFCSNL